MNQSIYIASALSSDKSSQGKTYGQQVYQQLKEKLNGQLREIQHHKKNPWCRDYLPVRNAAGQLVQFKYAPGYMTDTKKWRERIPDAKALHKELGLTEDQVTYSDIILDGGNVELHGSKAIVSDRVFRDNRQNHDYKNELDLLKALKDTLAVDQLIIVPQYPFDFTGHVDGLVRFIDAGRVLINDLQPELEQAHKLIREKKNSAKGRQIEAWYFAFLMALRNAGLQWDTLPYTATENSSDKDAAGIYLNFLQLQDRILMPAFGQKEDNVAAEKLKELYKKDIVRIEASELAAEGGIINCISWTRN
ncbi:agmatine deiminase family protein [Nafulsella turpanensis]|uniref:agmatine deiminase family protein n=1 Tax=Nafulsella turpanensis TaxID=1265690 RepID=UPI00034B308F|nr:agmatine deiminase family protein [Nafulsella turpanensis]